MSIVIGNAKYNLILGEPDNIECSIEGVANSFLNVLDKDSSSCFEINETISYPFSVVLDYGENNSVLSAYQIECSYSSEASLKSWEIKGSNDKETWTTIDYQADISQLDWSNTPVMSFLLDDNTECFRYYDFTMLDSNKSGQLYINEISFLTEDKTTPLRVSKVKRYNIPDTANSGVDTLYIVDDGFVYMTTKNGETIHLGGDFNEPVSDFEIYDMIANLWGEDIQEGSEDLQGKIISPKNLFDMIKVNNLELLRYIDSKICKMKETDCEEIVNSFTEIINREQEG